MGCITFYFTNMYIIPFLYIILSNQLPDGRGSSLLGPAGWLDKGVTGSKRAADGFASLGICIISRSSVLSPVLVGWKSGSLGPTWSLPPFSLPLPPVSGGAENCGFEAAPPK